MAPYVFLYVLSFLVVGLFNFVTAEVRTDILTSAEFWNKTISQNLANLIVFSTTIGLYNRKNMEEDLDFLHMDKTVTTGITATEPPHKKPPTPARSFAPRRRKALVIEARAPFTSAKPG